MRLCGKLFNQLIANGVEYIKEADNNVVIEGGIQLFATQLPLLTCVWENGNGVNQTYTYLTHSYHARAAVRGAQRNLPAWRSCPGTRVRWVCTPCPPDRLCRAGRECRSRWPRGVWRAHVGGLPYPVCLWQRERKSGKEKELVQSPFLQLVRNCWLNCLDANWCRAETRAAVVVPRPASHSAAKWGANTCAAASPRAASAACHTRRVPRTGASLISPRRASPRPFCCSLCLLFSPSLSTNATLCRQLRSHVRRFQFRFRLPIPFPITFFDTAA